MVRVGLRFLDKDKNLGNKTYWYLVKDKKVWEDLNKAAELSVASQNSSAFKIVNEKDYDYRDAWVVWVDVDQVKDGDEKNLVAIKKIKDDDTVRPRKKICFPAWGFCGINVPSNYDKYFYAALKDEDICTGFASWAKETVEMSTANNSIYSSPVNNYKPLKVEFDESIAYATNCSEPKYYEPSPLSHLSNGIAKLNLTTDAINSETIKKLIYGENSSIINIQNEKENVKMNTKFFDAQFGKVDDVSMSIYGATFKTVGTDGLARSIAYDPTTQEYIDVPNEMIIAKGSYCYAMPCTADNLHIGEYIRHNGAWARVIDVDDAARIVVEKIATREIATILPVRSVFGYSFYTKLITPFQSGFATADAAHPFGDILPLLMMGDGKMEDMLPLMLMMGQKGSTMFDGSNQMMLMMMLMNDKDDKNSKDSDMFKMMAMMSMFNQTKPAAKTDAHYCECDCCNTERKSY